MNMKKRYEQYVEDVINYIEEQASNSEVNEFIVYLPLSELAKYYKFNIIDTESWEAYFEISNVMICNRKWHMNAVGYYGYIEFEDAEYYGWED